MDISSPTKKQDTDSEDEFGDTNMEELGIIIDKTGDHDIEIKEEKGENKLIINDEEEYNFSDSDDNEDDKSSPKELKHEFMLKMKMDYPNKEKKPSKKEKGIDFDDVYVEISNPDTIKNRDHNLANKLNIIEELREQMIIKPGVEKLRELPSTHVSKNKKNRQNKLLREKCIGKGWHNLIAPEITEEVKRDLEIIKMRSVLDRKHFYKRSDQKAIPKFFQIGTVEDSPVDFYSDRIPKKQRKRTLVDELMADANFQRLNKKHYKEIIEERKRRPYHKAQKHAKKSKKKNK